MRLLTHLGGARVSLGTGFLMIVAGERRLGLAMLLANSMSNVLVQVLKRTVARPRPCDPGGQPLALVETPDPFSFPSGHAAAVTSVTAIAVLHAPLLAPVLLPLACLVAASRVVLRVHHVGDVLAGVALGSGGATVATLLMG